MPPAARLWGSAASTMTNLLLFGTIAALWPRIAACPWAICSHAGPAWTPIDTWRPFIDNPGAGAAGVEREPQCPEPKGRDDRYSLAFAPLPEAYDPHAYAGRPLYACVLVAGVGEVLDVRVLRGTARAALDRQIVRSIRRDWRFSGSAWGVRRPTWQRIRLNSGPVNGAIPDPPMLH